jgi:deoxyribodipyrimidine photolyase-related protein
MRAIHLLEEWREREYNFWGHSRPMPTSFYRASTTIEPVDRSIQRLNNAAYLNHIKRLMILGNFMLLCEIDPSDVYRWFMELFIDSYDWLMLPNVYGVRQHADGGRITAKPYLSTSNYVSRMSIVKRAIGAESETASTGGSSTSTASF